VLPVARRSRAAEHPVMSTKRNTTTAGWSAALVRALAYSPWLTFVIPPDLTFAARRERSGA
jgi:hypothetical protein